ncbi:MAG: hypothetical protein KKC21_03225 [Nitrospinae bacterium]|nr:hypothetical protein [Nitrospinota bacterium]
MKKAHLVTAIFLVGAILFLVYTNWDRAAKFSGSAPVPINPKAFDGFEKCDTYNELIEIADSLFANETPMVKEEWAWVYAVKSEFMGLPVDALELGVCDSTGERGCGWAMYTALVITKPLAETKKYLEDKTGIDFTLEERDMDTEVTLRPILAAGGTADKSVIFCDSGSL